MNQKQKKIGEVEFILMLMLTLVLYVLEWILDFILLGWAIGLLAWGCVWMWTQFSGIKTKNPSHMMMLNIVTPFASLFPVPAPTAQVLILYLMNKTETSPIIRRALHRVPAAPGAGM